jgi:sugar lactone lactonase YvrE
VSAKPLRHYQTTVRCAWGAQTLLGEGPVWDPRSQTLHFVNIKANDLLSFREKGRCRVRSVFGGLSAVFLTDTPRLLCATTRGLLLAEYRGASPRVLTPIEVGRPGNRTNDGKIDPLGRVWIGTMDDTEKAVTGALYRVDHDTAVTRVLDDIGVSNGLDWSPDGTVLYYTDSKRRVIWRFPFDMEAGTVGRPEVFATVPKEHGCPDGLTVDAEGFVWSAHWDGWRITRYDPEGTVERVVWLPVPRVTSLCFGGRRLDTLYITSARIGLSTDELLEAPLSGALFSCQPGVVGRPPNYARLNPLMARPVAGVLG